MKNFYNGPNTPSNPRKCIECEKTHDTIIEDTRTGERLSETDKCKDCLFENCFVEVQLDYEPLLRTENYWRKMSENLKKSQKLFNDCLFENCFVEWGGTARCMTSDGRNVNMAEELNRLEKELIDG